MLNSSERKDPALGSIDNIEEDNITPEIAEIITNRQKHETQKAFKMMSSLHSDQALTDIILKTRLLESGSITNEDVINRNFENKSAMTIEALHEELQESRDEIKELIDSGNLSFKERVQFKDLLSLMERYENKFSDNYTYNALLVGDIRQFSESIHFSINDPEYKTKLLDNNHELSRKEQFGFKLTQMSHRVGSAIDVIIDDSLYNVRESYYSTTDKINDGIDNVKNRVSEGYQNLKDKASEGIDSFKAKVLNTLLKAKSAVVISANAALFTAALGYHIGKSTVELAAKGVNNTIDKTLDGVEVIAAAVATQARNGYNKGVELAEGVINNAYNASIYTAAVSVVAARTTGLAVKGSGELAVSGAKKIGSFIKQSKENFSNAVSEESDLMKNRKRLPSV